MANPTENHQTKQKTYYQVSARKYFQLSFSLRFKNMLMVLYYGIVQPNNHIGVKKV